MRPLVTSSEDEWSVLRILVTTLWAPVEVAIAFFIVVPLFNPIVEIALSTASEWLVWGWEWWSGVLLSPLAVPKFLLTLPEPPRPYTALRTATKASPYL